MKKKQIVSYFVFILILFTSFSNLFLVTDVSADTPPEPDSPAYDYWYAPENSFGISETKEVNWTTFWTLFNSHSAWQLEAWHPVNLEWVDNWQGENLNEWLDISRNRSDDSNSEKITLTVTNNHPTQDLYFRFKFGIDARVKQYVNRSSWYEYELTYQANETENYTVYFNFTDVKPLIQNGVISAKHGIKEIDGKDIFWFMLTQNMSRQPLGHGKSFEIDPEFGYGTTHDDISGVDISSYPFAGTPHEHQAGLYGSPTSDGTLTYMLAYMREGYPITTLGAKAALYDASDMTIVDISNEVTIDGIMYAWYNFTFSGGEDIFDASNYYLTVYADAPAWQGPIPPTGVNIDLNEKAERYTYIREADMDNYPNFEDPWDGYTTYTNKAIVILCGYSEAVAIDVDVSPDTWIAGNVDVGTYIQENFTFWQNGSATIDITIGVNDTTLTFVNYATWLSLGHDRYCANFTIDNWVSESSIEPGYPPTSVLKSSFAPGSFTFGVRIWMPRTVTYPNEQEDFYIVLVIAESS